MKSPPAAYPAALRRCAEAARRAGDVVRAAELLERADAEAAKIPPSGPLEAMQAVGKNEADALLERAMTILDDIAADIGHAHATPIAGDLDLLTRILQLRALVDARAAIKETP